MYLNNAFQKSYIHQEKITEEPISENENSVNKSNEV